MQRLMDVDEAKEVCQGRSKASSIMSEIGVTFCTYLVGMTKLFSYTLLLPFPTLNRDLIWLNNVSPCQ